MNSIRLPFDQHLIDRLEAVDLLLQDAGRAPTREEILRQALDLGLSVLLGELFTAQDRKPSMRAKRPPGNPRWTRAS